MANAANLNPLSEKNLNGRTQKRTGFHRRKIRHTKKNGPTGEAYLPTVNKMRGVESLVSTEDQSVSELTMLDWYASFALMSFACKIPYNELPETCFNIAEEMLRERKKREQQINRKGT
jgi:hypothetical protein